MDEIDMLRRYAARSAPSPPPIDVTADVLETLRHDPRATAGQASPLRPLWSVAAAGWLIAVSLTFFASQAWAEVQDPLGALLAPFVVNLQ
jgi:hypothetical protein